MTRAAGAGRASGGSARRPPPHPAASRARAPAAINGQARGTVTWPSSHGGSAPGRRTLNEPPRTSGREAALMRAARGECRDGTGAAGVPLRAAAPPFIRAGVGHPDFRRHGALHGADARWSWAVVDPLRHPVEGWRKGDGARRTYAGSAAALDAVVFTNGPLVGKRGRATGKVTAGRVVADFAAATGSGVVAGAVLARRRRGGWAWPLAGGAAMAGGAWRRSFAGWTTCGAARSARNAIDESRTFDREGPRHAWIGRYGSTFASYAVGFGDPPDGAVEALGGLVLLLRSYELPGTGRAGADYAAHAAKRGAGGWGLVPVAPGAVDGDPPDGVVVVMAAPAPLGHVAQLLRAIGARDAVAVDPRGSRMMGAAGRFTVGPPPPHRQAIQTYGLCCR